MTERHKQLVLAIETIADKFTSDSNSEEKSYWREWFKGHRNLALTTFAEYKKMQEQYVNHPDFNKVINDRDYIDIDGLMGIYDSIDHTRQMFFKIALPVMLRDTGGSKIQESITEIDGPVQDDGRQRVVMKWNKLQENQNLNNEAWAHIGKELTFRLFNKVYNEETRGLGRPKKLLKNEHIYVARQVLALKRALYEPYYDLAPFSDVEIVTALLSNPQSDKLKAVLANMGLTNLISVERVCNMVSAGRKELSGFWLREDSISIADEEFFDYEDYGGEEGVTLEQRIAFAKENLGPLLKIDKEAIEQGFLCPTEVRQALARPNLTKVNLEEIVTWTIMPEQIKEVIAVAKTKFGLTRFKSLLAQKKARDYW